MKSNFTLLFCFCTFFLFAQPRKGDLFLGVSQSNLGRSVQEFGLMTGMKQTITFNESVVTAEFGIMLSDNFLLGGGVRRSAFSSLHTDESDNTRRQQLFFECFGVRYFGHGRVSPFIAGRMNYAGQPLPSQFGNSLVKETFNIALTPGVAFYLTENTALELGYQVLAYSLGSGGEEWFPDKFIPRVGLTLRQYLFRNREGREHLAAHNFIRSGVGVAEGAGSFIKNDDITRYTFNTNLIYFPVNGFYAGTGVSWLRHEQNRVARSLLIDLKGGAYIPIKRKYLYLLTEMGCGRKLITNIRANRSFIILATDADIRTDFHSWKLGAALFYGRHKTEITYRKQQNHLYVAELDAASERYSNRYFILDHELFLTEKLSIKGNFSFSPGFKSVILLIDSGFTSPATPPVRVFETEEEKYDFALSFKWYLRGSN